MKSNAAASQSSGRRGILLSLLLPPLLLLSLMLFYLEQTECAQALMKMQLAQSRRNLGVRKTETVRTSRAFRFDHPKRKLRQPFFRIGKRKSRKIEIHGALSFSCKLFRHQRLTAGDGSPIDVTLRFTRHVGAYSRKIIAFSKVC